MTATRGLAGITARLRLPLIVAPMTGVSTAALVVAAMDAGVLGALPAHNVADGVLDETVAGLADRSRGHGTPWALNVVVHPTNARRDAELAAAAEHRPDVVLASVGSPAPAVDALRGTGVVVLAAVASIRHASRAVQLGADGLVLLTAGAGGQTGHLSPFAFARAVRRRTEVPFVVAGGIPDGHALWAAVALGASLGAMGTRFVVARESDADEGYRADLVQADLDDIRAHDPGNGVPVSAVSWTIPRASGGASQSGFEHAAIGTETSVRSAGHSVGGVGAASEPFAEIVGSIADEYRDAARRSCAASVGPAAHQHQPGANAVAPEPRETRRTDG